MKMLLLFTALTLSGAAYAQDSTPVPEAPDATAPAAAAPDPATPEPTAAPATDPSAKSYPPCSKSVTDNCMEGHSRRHVTSHHRVMKKK